MAKPEPDRLIEAARQALENPMDFETFLAKLAQKDRVNAQRRVEVLEAEPDPSLVRRWKHLTCALMSLAAHSAKLVGRQMIQFYVADGKYRMQVFALEDLQDGQFTLYCPNVLKEAMDAGLIRGAAEGQPNLYALKAGGVLYIETIDGQSLDSAPHFKDMVGWNRKAIRIVISPAPSPAQVEATVLLCAIAAGQFRKAGGAGET